MNEKYFIIFMKNLNVRMCFKKKMCFNFEKLFEYSVLLKVKKIVLIPIKHKTDY